MGCSASDAIRNPGGGSGFAPVAQKIDAQGKGVVKIIVQLRPHAGVGKAYPPFSTNPELNYVFGVYAAKLEDWDKAKTYWTKSLELFPTMFRRWFPWARHCLSRIKLQKPGNILSER